MAAQWTDISRSMLIQEFQTRPILWDKRLHCDLNSRVHRAEALFAVTNSLNQAFHPNVTKKEYTVDDVKQQWKNLKDTFVRKQRWVNEGRYCHDPYKEPAWKFYRLLRFLDIQDEKGAPVGESPPAGDTEVLTILKQTTSINIKNAELFENSQTSHEQVMSLFALPKREEDGGQPGTSRSSDDAKEATTSQNHREKALSPPTQSSSSSSPPLATPSRPPDDSVRVAPIRPHPPPPHHEPSSTSDDQPPPKKRFAKCFDSRAHQLESRPSVGILPNHNGNHSLSTPGAHLTPASNGVRDHNGAAAINGSTNMDEYALFGAYVAAALRRMASDGSRAAAARLQKSINDIVYDANIQLLEK